MHRWQVVTLVVLLLVAGVAGYGAYYYYSLQGDIQKEIQGIEKGAEGKPFNALLVGSDSREGLTEQEQLELGAAAVGGQRADTLILAHIDPAENFVTMVQFPRDLWVPIAGDGKAKINSVLERGPNALVRTMEALTGLPINQYVQVNIAGFRNLVDAIDGVDVCITEPIPFDPKTGLEITAEETGLVHLTGNEALRFVRSRHFETGDFERIRNQQKFVAAAIDKVVSASTLLSPGRIKNLADVARHNVVTDDHTTIGGLVNLGKKLRSFDPKHYEAYTAPNLGVGAAELPSGEQVSIVVPDEPAMKVMFEAISANDSPAQADRVPDVAPPTVRVGVYNGTLVDGKAQAAADALKEATDTGAGGVEIVEVDNVESKLKGTAIRYRPRAKAMAELMKAALPDAKLVEARTEAGIDIEVIVGKGRFRTHDIVQILPIPIPPPGKLPEECQTA